MPTTTQRRVALDRETLFASLLHHLDRHRRVLDVQSTLGTADLRLLWLLTDGTARSLRQIAEELHLEQSTVNRQVNAAVRAGHLRRTRRSTPSTFLFEPTDEGREIFQRETAVALALYGDALDALGPEPSGQLIDLLARFVDRYGEAVDRAAGGR